MDTSNLIQIQFYLPHFNIPDLDLPIEFPAFVTSFSDNYTSNWKAEQAFGFQDQVGIFQGTSRKITVGIKIMAQDAIASWEYQRDLNSIVASLYPAYASGVPKSSPIIGIKMANLIQSSKTKSGFLWGWLDGFDLTPDFGDAGVFSVAGKEGAAAMLPRMWEVSFAFNVIHKKRPGFSGATFSLGTATQFPVKISKIALKSAVDAHLHAANRGGVHAASGRLHQKLSETKPTAQPKATNKPRNDGTTGPTN